MAETLTSSSRDGGGSGEPPAPPTAGDDLPWEGREVQPPDRTTPEQIRKLPSFVLGATLQETVFGIGLPTDQSPAPFGKEQSINPHILDNN